MQADRLKTVWGGRLVVAALVALGFAAAPLAAPAPRGDDGVVLAIMSPWADADALLAAADGQPLGPWRAPFGVLATGEGADFRDRLRAAGVWAVLDGAAAARWCGVGA